MSRLMRLTFGSQALYYMSMLVEDIPSIAQLSKNAQTLLSCTCAYRTDEATPTPRLGAMGTSAPTVIAQGNPVTPEVHDRRYVCS